MNDKNKLDYFSLELLQLPNNISSLIRPVTSVNIYKPSSNSFDENGLFSTTIFGAVGSSERTERFSYINLNTKILHPLIFKEYMNLKQFYFKVAKGIEYGKFDEEIKDIVPSTIDKGGETGYDFVVRHIKKINFPRNKSSSREARIKLINNHSEEELFMDKLLVYPAGLRDYYVDENGRGKEDEVNAIYRKVIGLSNILTSFKTLKGDLTPIDGIRLRLQLAVVEIYDYFMSILEGKRGFIQDKWVKRAVETSTRNIIAPIPSNIKNLNDPDRIGYNSIVIGLYQYIKAVSPIIKHRIYTRVVPYVIDEHTNKAKLINPKTLETEIVDISQKSREKWTTDDGVDSIMNRLLQDDARLEDIYVDKYYLGVVYDDGNVVKFIFDTTTIGDIDKSKLRPMKYGEFFYWLSYDLPSKYPGFTSRYPIAGLGSIILVIPYLKTTIPSRKVKILHQDSWEDGDVVKEYPREDAGWFNSMGIHPTKLSGLSADFDGDKMQFYVAMTEEGIRDMFNILNSPSYYLSSGGLNFKNDKEISMIVCKTLTE